MPFYSGLTESELPPWLKQRHRDIAEKHHQHANLPFESYKGSRLAEIPENLKKAHKLSEKTGSYAPYLQRSERLLEGAKKPFYESYQQYLNPYTNAVVNRISEEGMRTFNEQMMPALEAKFLRLGQHGSTQHARLAQRAARDVQSDILAKQQQALASGYQQAAQMYNADQARLLETAKELSGLGGLHHAGQLGDIAMLGEAGRYKQQQEQAKRDLAYQDFLRQQNYPLEMLEREGAFLQGIPIPQSTATYQQTPMTPQLNVLGQLGNLAGNIYSLSRYNS